MGACLPDACSCEPPVRLLSALMLLHSACHFMQVRGVPALTYFGRQVWK